MGFTAKLTPFTAPTLKYAKVLNSTTMTDYKGFQIDHLNRVFKNGKQVFPSRFVAWDTIEQAMTAIDASIMAGEMLAKFPNLSKIDLNGICELENRTERDEQAERWTESEAEKQLNETAI